MVRERLKTYTKTAHHEIESLLNYTDPNLSLEDYKKILKKLYSFYYPLELKLSALFKSTKLDIFEGRKKIHLLKADLIALDCTAREISEIGLCTDFPCVNSVAEAMGTLYVIEGSTLGGQILKKHFETQFDLNSQKGAAFFSGYQEKTGLMWKHFVQFLESLPWSETEMTALETSALDTFRKLGNTLRSSVPKIHLAKKQTK